LLQFIARLRELSGGKPVGFKLCVGHPIEWFGIAKAMLRTDIVPDFIVVDGAEGGTGAAPAEFSDHVGMPLRDGLRLGAQHADRTRAQTTSENRCGRQNHLVVRSLARTLAIGADWCNSARGFMFAVGCLQSLHCHTDACPTGVATQDPLRQKALVVADKSLRVKSFHAQTVASLAELVGAAGLEHPSQLRPTHIMMRDANGRGISFARSLDKIAKGALRSESFDPESFLNRSAAIGRRRALNASQLEQYALRMTA
jgi:glutamate synthase domain-containing protein 2